MAQTRSDLASASNEGAAHRDEIDSLRANVARLEKENVGIQSERERMQEAQLRLAREAEGNLSQLQIERDANARAQNEINILRQAQADDNKDTTNLELVQKLQLQIEELHRQCREKDTKIQEQALQIAQKDGQLQHVLSQTSSSKNEEDKGNDRREIDRLRNLNEQLSQAQLHQLAAAQKPTSDVHELERLRSKNEFLQDQLSAAQQSVIEASARAVGAEKELSSALNDTQRYREEMEVLKESTTIENTGPPQAERDKQLVGKYTKDIAEIREHIELTKEALDVTLHDLKNKELECEEYFAELQRARAMIDKMHTEHDNTLTTLQTVRSNHDEIFAELRVVERTSEDRLQEIERLSVLNQSRLTEIETLSSAHQQLLDKLLNTSTSRIAPPAQVEHEQDRPIPNRQLGQFDVVGNVKQSQNNLRDLDNKHSDDEGVVENDDDKSNEVNAHRSTTVLNASFADTLEPLEESSSRPQLIEYEESDDSSDRGERVHRSDMYTPAIVAGAGERSNRRFSCVVRSTRAARRLHLLGPATLQINRGGISLFAGTSAVFEGDEATIFWYRYTNDIVDVGGPLVGVNQ